MWAASAVEVIRLNHVFLCGEDRCDEHTIARSFIFVAHEPIQFPTGTKAYVACVRCSGTKFRAKYMYPPELRQGNVQDNPVGQKQKSFDQAMSPRAGQRILANVRLQDIPLFHLQQGSQPEFTGRAWSPAPRIYVRGSEAG